MLGDNVRPRAYLPAQYPGWFLWYTTEPWIYGYLGYSFVITITPPTGLGYGLAPDR
jgi:hypothetical protein